MRHFIDLTDWSTEEIQHLLDLSIELKQEYKTEGNRPLLKGKALACIFEKPSLRTRVSFEVGMHHLGGTALSLLPSEIGLGKRESIADVARTLSSYVHCIMARVFDHQVLLELAKYSSAPIINGLSDTQHPCQTLADLLTIREHFGQLKGLNIVYVGDGNNVATSLLHGAAHVGSNFTLAAPAGYSISEEEIERISTLANENETKINLYHDPVEAVRHADVIYTDTWVSMGQEDDTSRRLQDLASYQVNPALLAHAPAHAIVMHCLPAHRGQEILDEVADGPQSAIFQQAENRLHAQKAVLVELMTNQAE